MTKLYKDGEPDDWRVWSTPIDGTCSIWRKTIAESIRYHADFIIDSFMREAFRDER